MSKAKQSAEEFLEPALTELRERHTPTVIPPCRVCGGELDMQSVGGGEPTVWACSGQEEDPDKPGSFRYKEGRTPADLHYSNSRFFDRRHVSSLVIDLLDRLPKALAMARAEGRAQERERQGRPHVITLCGSTRCTPEMMVVRWELEKKGNIVLTWNVLPDTGNTPMGHIAEAEGVKEALDELHKRKIDMSDEVFVLNIGGYIGESTRSEIEYATANGVPVNYIENQPEAGKGE